MGSKFTTKKKKRGNIIFLTFQDGTQVPYAQFVLSDKQQVAILGVDLNQYPNEKLGVMDIPNCRVEKIGKIGEIKSEFAIQLMNLLASAGWNYKRYTNPEILIITRG
jgi:hypothetical protein